MPAYDRCTAHHLPVEPPFSVAPVVYQFMLECFYPGDFHQQNLYSKFFQNSFNRWASVNRAKRCRR